MRLEEPTMGLCFNGGEHLRLRYPDIQPGRHGHHIQPFHPMEQELCDDLLDPGRPRLGIGGDDDIIRAKVKGIPDRGIKMVIMELSGLLGPWDFCLCHCRLSSWGASAHLKTLKSKRHPCRITTWVCIAAIVPRRLQHEKIA